MSHAAPSKPLPPSALSATLAMASLSLRRLRRGRGLIALGVLALLPVVFAVVTTHVAQHPTRTRAIAGLTLLIMGIAPASLIAGSLADEFESRTIAYLWSRPLPRWTVMAGRLVAMVPVMLVLVLLSFGLSHLVAQQPLPGPLWWLALTLGMAAFACVAAAMAVLFPRFPMVTSLSYAMFFDAALARLPLTARELTITFHVEAIAGQHDVGLGHGLLGLALIILAWTGLGLWRIRRLE